MKAWCSWRVIIRASALCALLGGLLLSCKTTSGSGSNVLADAVQSDEYFNRVPQLGDGIDVDLMHWAPNGNCFTPSISVPVGNIDNSVHYIATHVDSVQSAGAQLGFSSGVELSYGLIKGNISASYASSATSSDLASTWIFTEEVVTTSTQFQGNQLAVTSTGWSFRNKCGNRYVSQITYGARVSAIIKFQFSDKHTMESFQQNFSLSVITGQWGAKVSDSINTKFQNANSASSVSIELIKAGGPDPSSSLKGSPVVNCKAGDPTTCSQILAALANYVGTFSGGVTAENSSVISFATSAYPLSDSVTDTPVMSASAKAALTDLSNEYLSELTDKNRASDLLANPNLMEKRPLLQNIVSTVMANQPNLASAIQTCVDSNGQSCVYHNDASLSLKKYDTAVLTLFTTIGNGRGYNNSNYVGGPGGSLPTDPNVSQCYDYLNGFYSRGGAVIDQLGIACYSARGNDWRPLVGKATNASLQTPITCVQGSAVTAVGVKIDTTGVIQGLAVTCTNINDIQTSAVNPKTYTSGVINWAAGDEAKASWTTCSSGSYAIGVNFKAGAHIDGLSLQCVPIKVSTLDPTAPVNADPTAPSSDD